jgi:FkbM family methyltransferase
MPTAVVDSPVRHRRSLEAITHALFRPQNYTSVASAFRYCEHPVDFLKRYISNGGSYPATVRLRTPTSPIDVNVYCSDDIQTINEIFFRGDYHARQTSRIVVDFGSNIGISAKYFLSLSPDAYVYCYEPLPQNTERLKRNLAGYEGRYELAEVAVGPAAGTVRFGWEPTGRYGGVGRETGNWIDVECIDSNAILEGIIAKHGRIDLLKVDIETLEKIVTDRIPLELAQKIGYIFVEFRFTENPLSATHAMISNNYITVFKPLKSA